MAEKRKRSRPTSRASRLLSRILIPLFSLLLAMLAGYGLWEYGGDSSAPVLAMPEGALLTAQVLDVGQGSSFLLQAGDQLVLIDAGEREAAEAIDAALKARSASSIDLVILTHPHADHYGGLLSLLGEYEVDELWMPPVPEEILPSNRSFESLLDAIEQNGASLSLTGKTKTRALGEGVRLSLLDGFVADADNLNDTSLCVRIDAGEASFLITGDGEGPMENRLLEANAKQALDADIYVAGHHGSSTSSKQKLLDAITPKATAISCGADNSYGHPNEKVLTRLAPFGPIYRTDLSGTITFATDGNTITVTSNNQQETIDARG